ncbi:MAG TPA: hypothetical protein VF787_24615 [Thermoanaerobaculia bacterium]
MANNWMELLETVNDEQSFVRFLRALREDCESEKECPRYDQTQCMEANHWQTRSTDHFLHSMEEWAADGDFGAGRHHGEPILRRVATMLYVGRYLRSEDRDQWRP